MPSDHTFIQILVDVGVSIGKPKANMYTKLQLTLGDAGVGMRTASSFGRQGYLPDTEQLHT